MDYMNYFSLISSLSKDDLKDLAKQMKVCCSGNKTEICGRIMKIVEKFDDSTDQVQTGGFDYSKWISKKSHKNQKKW